MNVQLPLVVSDITGVTGLRILRDIVAGAARLRTQLARHRDYRCHGVRGRDRGRAHGELPARARLRADRRISHSSTSISSGSPPVTPRSRPISRRSRSGRSARRRRSRRRGARQTRSDNEPALRRCAHPAPPAHAMPTSRRSTGSARTPRVRLVAEIGTDMTRWPSEHHFTSWLTLAPRNKISGGRLLSSHTQPSANRAAALLRIVAMSLSRTQTALGAFYRRLAYRVGKAKAITATARKLAILVYRTLKGGFVYQDPGADAYDGSTTHAGPPPHPSARSHARLRPRRPHDRRGTSGSSFLGG